MLFGDAVWPSWKPSTAREHPPLGPARPARRAGRALRPVGGLGVPRVVRRAGRAPGDHAGLQPAGVARHRGARAQRRPRGGRRARHDADGQADRAGPRRRCRAEPAVGQRRDRRDRPHRLHPVAQRGGRDRRRRHRDLARAGEVPGHRQRRHPPPDRADDPARDQAGRVRHRYRRDVGHDPAVRAGSCLARAAEQADRRRPVEYRVPLPVRPAAARRLCARARGARHLRGRAWL